MIVGDAIVTPGSVTTMFGLAGSGVSGVSDGARISWVTVWPCRVRHFTTVIRLPFAFVVTFTTSPVTRSPSSLLRHDEGPFPDRLAALGDERGKREAAGRDQHAGKDGQFALVAQEQVAS